MCEWDADIKEDPKFQAFIEGAEKGGDEAIESIRKGTVGGDLLLFFGFDGSEFEPE